MHKNTNRIKIIATIGPASSEKDTLTELVKAGVDVVRLNFSHGTHADHAQVINRIREINKKLESNIGILADLQGPKLRIGDLEKEGELLEEGENITITTEECVGNTGCVYLNYDAFPSDVAVGDFILIDDGKIQLEVTKTDQKKNVSAKVVYGGPLYSRKGVNLPSTKISLPSITEKDYKDLEFITAQDVDWVALSFVRSEQDVVRLREYMRSRDKHPKIIAKIEKPQAIDAIDKIIDECDAVMIARGDLGVELPLEETPGLQKEIVNKCIQNSKPVIIATQMMESMITNSRPTRAEVSDVANAAIDGADAVMLSAETAVGKFPVLVIESMVKILGNIENSDVIYNKNLSPDKSSPTFFSDAICYNAARLAESVDAKAIVGMTISGYTAFMISSFRPKAKIFIFTENRRLLNTLSLVWGVRGLYYDKFVSTDHTINDVKEILKEKGYVNKGDVIINSASMPLHAKGRTNMVKITIVE